MRIVCAESVLFGREAFSTLGDVVVLPDGKIDGSHLRDAEVLAIRSKTAVTAERLAGSRLRFVGTATAGFDHMDTDALDAAGIAWHAAAGCNAESVAEYITAALLALALREERPLEGMTLGVIGVGQVGRRVARNARVLGMQVLENDPPRAEREPDSGLLRLDEVLPQCDAITLHVPLTDGVPHATRGMADAGWFRLLRSGALFLNASRGEVVDEPALLAAMDEGRIRRSVLDVWDHEPWLDDHLLCRTDLATPHIAGYSYDGKLRGTEMIYAECCRVLGVEPSWDAEAFRPAPALPETTLDAAEGTDEAALYALVRRMYDIEADDRALRLPPEPDRTLRGRKFEHLRRTYPVRREFPFTRVRLVNGTPELSAKIRGLRFGVAP